MNWDFAALLAIALPSAVQLLSMQDRSGRATHEPPRSIGSEGCSVNSAQWLLEQFRTQRITPGPMGGVEVVPMGASHASVSQSHRRMLDSSAVNAWQRVIKVGWRGCAAPDP